MYHDLSAGYEFASGVRVRAAVNNLFDEDPPFVNSGSISNTDSDTYRLLGRMYFLELRYSFE